MIIECVDIYLIDLPLRKPRTPETVPYSEGWPQWTGVRTVVVRLRTNRGDGWGEASPGNAPFMTAEWSDATFRCLRDWMAPRIVGRDIADAGQLQGLLTPIKGHRYARAALDIAWWDLQARLKNQPLHQLLQAKETRIPLGIWLDRTESHEDFLREIAAAFEAGYSRVGLKLRPGWDLAMLNAVRQEFPTENIMGDLEGALGLHHMDTLCRLDDFGLRMVEQPLPPEDLVGHAMLQETLRTPICLDESITTPELADMALELRSCKYVNINVGRVGGLTSAVAIYDACHAECVPNYLGLTPQSSIGMRASLALAGRGNFCYPADYWSPSELLAQDLVEPISVQKDEQSGTLVACLPETPGLGVEPNPNDWGDLIRDTAQITRQ
ncbi:enolase C-terminal domain-like protein [Thermopirellula anaerolimosa]